MHSIDKQAFLAMGCYNEDRFEADCKTAFPDAIFHKRETDTEYFGWLDHRNGTASVWMAGTHGENLLKLIIAWAGNLAASDNDDDGRHDGFQMLAEQIFRQIGGYLLGYDTLYFFGHSRACSVLAILAKIIKDQDPDMKISGRVFCPAVPGNAKFAKEFNSVIPDWIFYRMKGDLINTAKMRDAKSDFLDGVDAGIARDLPPAGVLQYVPGVRAIAHTSKRVVKSLEKMYQDIDFNWVRRAVK
jgi:hypothetical protein